MTESVVKIDRDWWRGAVIYQIYPRSYQDSNDDGVGDLAGITARLEHIASLGVDAVWISPFFRSPMKDFGYDVSDYCDVDPLFGQLSDFDGLIAEAHRLGIRVMIDLVLSHTSDQHPWFVESRASRDNSRADWYVWADAKPDGTPPNNWLSIFGGSAWQWDSRRQQYYLHNFLTSQPDLNFHCPAVQEALLDVTRFWLKRGVDGFRLDTINFYIHDKLLRDNPPLVPERRNATIAPAVNPYNHQEHLHDKNQPENLEFLKRFRAVLDEFPAIASVGEVGDAQKGLQIVGEYTSGNDKVHMCYAFEFLAADRLSPRRVRDVQERFGDVASDGWACWAFSNHDVMRHITRWGDGVIDHVAHARMLMALLMSIRGSVCIYQGEELGLDEAELAYEDLQDPYGIQFWPEFKGRDGCRTPMVWNGTSTHGGFSNVKPWLPVPPSHLVHAVSVENDDPASLLNHYRLFIEFRKQHPAFAKGDIDFLEADDQVLVFTRTFGNETILVAINMTERSAITALPEGAWEALEGHGFTASVDRSRLDLPAFGAYFARRA